MGFAELDPGLRRNVVGGLGVVDLLVGLLGFVDPALFGLLPSGYTVVDNLIHLVLGVAGIAVAWVIGRRRRLGVSVTGPPAAPIVRGGPPDADGDNHRAPDPARPLPRPPRGPPLALAGPTACRSACGTG